MPENDSETDRPFIPVRVSDGPHRAPDLNSKIVNLGRWRCRMSISHPRWEDDDVEALFLYQSGERWIRVEAKPNPALGFVQPLEHLEKRAWWIDEREAIATILASNMLGIPDDLRPLFEKYDATSEPAPAGPKPIQAPAESIQAPPNPAPAPVSIEAPAAPSPVDFAKVAMELRKDRKAIPAALVEYMSDRDEATVEDVGEHVHGGAVTDGAVRANVDRTNRHLEAMVEPLRFRVASGRVFREISAV